MPTQTQWLIDRRVLLITVQGILTADEMSVLHDEIIARLNCGNAKVHLLYDLRLVEQIPSFQTWLQSKIYSQARLGWMLCIIPPEARQLRFIISTLGHIFRMRQRFVGSVEAGLRFLPRVDTTLAMPHKPPTTPRLERPLL